MKKLYLVSREVFATNIKQAMTAKGKIYSIQLAADTVQPQPELKNVGFKLKNQSDSSR